MLLSHNFFIDMELYGYNEKVNPGVIRIFLNTRLYYQFIDILIRPMWDLETSPIFGLDSELPSKDIFLLTY